MDRRVREWLATDDARVALDRAVREIKARAWARGLSPALVTRNGFAGSGPAVDAEEIRSELVLFIAENSSRLAPVIAGESRNIHSYLRYVFINHWIDKTRTPERDPRRYLYRRTQEILRGSGEFETTATQKGRAMTFSMDPGSRRIPPLCEEDLKAVTFPHDRLEYSSVNRKEILLSLAAHFWKGISGLWGDIPVWIDLRDFVSWIGLHVPLACPEVEGEDPEGEPFVERVPDYTYSPETLYFDPDLVRLWAEKFARRLTPRERELFFLQYGKGLGPGHMARELGYRGSSGPEYHMTRIRDKLRFFLADLPWLSPDGFNEEAYHLFREAVLSFLKKGLSGP